MSEHSEPQIDPIHDAVSPEGNPAEAAEHTSDDVMNAATSEIETLRAEAADMRDKWMRAEAEMQNLRARAKREVDDARQYAVQKFARDVVEAAENLQRGLASLPAATEGEDPIITKMREGFESTERSFKGILERNGITGTHPVGHAFDANLHQAMAEAHSDDHPQGTVTQAWTPAWTLHGRLLKPAMVVVSKGPSGEGGA
ncbi:heat shock protein GrpE [Ameyamaea chiangmaiensis NBRC 103196]|uniref:Protein GrpE n=1 Tax=Ameyamaea chiangmaiensis TaxID=442969 RepID=A0A850PIH3_9PROT|nr:nucleotide exchange factor GrpE [Ameyamaea chiangmaiensis]MBS4075304.1 nucleotide exchange factor GrpE [Ameyamaea chiangmaiensis]NVN41041.1 nucleotide exchange factor GrpE [Ameyamaea chiangmaiensis]GBQ66701.1 heat shock protein GrpE [Ameyamaea chiangmaiensis NBRC 103196]